MRDDDLRALLRRNPCPLLRLHVTGGMVFEVADPDMLVVSRSAVELALSPNGNQTREAVISLLHIVWVEVITPS
jgi:hypothetical protein